MNLQNQFTRQELEEIKKWANVIGYQGTAPDLLNALQLNRAIVSKIEAQLSPPSKSENSYAEDRAEVDA